MVLQRILFGFWRHQLIRDDGHNSDARDDASSSENLAFVDRLSTVFWLFLFAQVDLSFAVGVIDRLLHCFVIWITVARSELLDFLP